MDTTPSRGYSNYNKIENGNREPSDTELQQLTKLFNMSVEDILNFDGKTPTEVTFEDNAGFEQVSLINQLDDEDKQTVFKIIDTMLTKKKFNFFLNNNIAAL